MGRHLNRASVSLLICHPYGTLELWWDYWYYLKSRPIGTMG